MAGELETVFHTEGLLGDYFVLESNLVSSRTADLYRALDKSRGAHVSLWVMRRPFPMSSPSARAFLSRLSKIQRIEPPISNIISYGVDAAGIGFCVFPNLSGFPILTGNIEVAEAERRLTSATRLIDKLHSLEIACGDICASSFWVERTGEIRFIGVMDGIDSEFVGEAVLPPLDTMHFIAPEQAAGGKISIGCDIFALGVLGYQLFTKRYPFSLPEGADRGEIPAVPLYGTMPPISKYQLTPPVWCEQVFTKCLAAAPGERYASAGEIVAAIGLIRENVFAAEKTPARLHHDGQLTKRAGEHLPKVQSDHKDESKPSPVTVQRKVFLKAGLVIMGVFFISFLAFKELLGGHESGGGIETMPEDMQKDPRIQGVFGAQDVDAKKKYFTEFIDSDDPLAHDILLQAARAARDEKERVMAETALLDRARRLGLRRSVEVVRPWLRSVKGDKFPDSYNAVLRSLDVTLPLEARNSSLREAYASNPRVVLRLTAALAIDTDKLDEYQKVLSQLVGDATGEEDLLERSVPAIILYSTELVPSFGDDIIQRKEKIPDNDVPWLLNILSMRNDIYVRPIASLAVERNLLSATKQTYLTMIRDREDLPADIINTLVKAAAGVLAAGDVSVLGTWLDRQSEDILILLLADQFPKEVKIEAFDILAGKNFSREPTVSLTKWVRTNAWNEREKYVEPIGVLSNLSLFKEEQVINAIDAFGPNLKDPSVLGALLESGQPALSKALMDRYPERIPLGKRFTMLKHQDHHIRILAIKSLKDMQDLAGMKILLDHYYAEKDPDVRALYEETFWFVRERKKQSNF